MLRDQTEGAPQMSRYSAFALSVLLLLLSFGAAAWLGAGWWIAVAVFGLLSIVGTVDMLQSHSTLRRNYPLL